MENIMNIYRNLSVNIKIVLICIVFCAVQSIIGLPGFVWMGLGLAGIIIGAKAAYGQYVRMNNAPTELGSWVDDRVNNVINNVKDDPFNW